VPHHYRALKQLWKSATNFRSLSPPRIYRKVLWCTHPDPDPEALFIHYAMLVYL